MPYTHYTTDKQNALQAMAGIYLPKCYMPVMLGKHLSGIYKELNRSEAQSASEQSRLDNKPRRGELITY
ncbi:MAG: hypothetical protein LBB22_01520 [Treponema sp.]|jgi:hypothetical protein|nr:hypothetical protein [Treponema sp.]